MPTPGKLGKLAPIHDPRTLSIRSFLRPRPATALPAPPNRRVWDHGVTDWGMMLNGPQPVMPPGVPPEGIGDCTCAAVGHSIQLATANTGLMVTLPDAIILQLYETVGGYRPGNPATDGGAVVLTLLKEWQKNGIAGRRALAYAACSLTDERDVQDCIELFGFTYLGFNVPRSAMNQFEQGQPWDVNDRLDNTIDGGHAVIGVDFDADGITVISWRQLQRMTWRFWHKYVDEAYGVVLPEWVAQNGLNPAGINLQALLDYVTQLTTDPAPPVVVQPDPALVAWLVWAKAVADFVQPAYQRGDTAAALAWETQLAQYTPGILAMLQGEPHALAAEPPGGPA